MPWSATTTMLVVSYRPLAFRPATSRAMAASTSAAAAFTSGESGP
jgi:hypothetical protein